MNDEDKLLYEKAKKALKIGNLEELATALKYAKTTSVNWYKGGFNDTVRMKIDKAIRESSQNTIQTLQKKINNITVAPSMTTVRYFPDVHTAAGYGAVNGDGEPEMMMFPTEMLQTMLGITDFNNLDIINVTGDSMEPIVHHGDTIMIRHTHDVRNGEIAILKIDGEIYIKRFQRDPKGKWIRLTSDNELYRVMDFDGDEMNDIQVIGILIGKFKPF